MNYRGRECTESRAFADGTGTGTEWRLPAASATGKPWPEGQEWCYREHATRVISDEEKAANESANKVMLEAEKRGAALTALIDEKLAAKVAP